MENETQDDESKTPVPKKSNKTILVVIGVIIGLFVLGSIVSAVIGWFAFSKVTSMGDGAMGEAFKQIQVETEKSYDEDEDDDDNNDDYDRFAADDNDYIDDYGGRVYATKHGIPDEFPASITIVEPSELKQVSSQAQAKGETPMRWHVITESGFATVEETKAAIETTYDGFGEKIDRTAVPGAEQYAASTVMLSYNNDQYSVNMIATQETEYQKGPVGNFMIVYDIVVK